MARFEMFWWSGSDCHPANRINARPSETSSDKTISLSTCSILDLQNEEKPGGRERDRTFWWSGADSAAPAWAMKPQRGQYSHATCEYPENVGIRGKCGNMWKMCECVENVGIRGKMWEYVEIWEYVENVGIRGKCGNTWKMWE